MQGIDRQNSILTPSRRRALLGMSDGERTGRNKRTFESDTRKRIRSGLADFAILSGAKGPGLDERNLKHIFNSLHSYDNDVAENIKKGPIPKARNRSDTVPAWIATTHMVSFAYQGLRAIGDEPHEALNEAILRGALHGEAAHQDVSREYVFLIWDEDNDRVDITVHDEADSEPLEKWKQDLPMTPAERGELHEELIEVVPEDVYEDATPMDFDDLVGEYLVSEE
jgi:hypothetical protein